MQSKTVLNLEDLQPGPKRTLTRTLKLIAETVSLVLVVAGFVLTNLPKLSVEVSGSSPPNDAIGNISLFNRGSLPIYDVTVGCEVTRVDLPSPQNGRFVGPTVFYFPESRAEILLPGHNMMIPCGRVIASRVDNVETLEFHAGMFLVVTYRPKWLFWHKSEKFPMETQKTGNGTWVLKSIPR